VTSDHHATPEVGCIGPGLCSILPCLRRFLNGFFRACPAPTPPPTFPLLSGKRLFNRGVSRNESKRCVDTPEGAFRDATHRRDPHLASYSVPAFF
jgi:hypothetical protein